jgi:uncharacterized metal-binding protein YceD (DUF177 family)
VDETFKIYIHRLKDGRTEKIDEILTPEFMEMNDPELAFKVPIEIHGGTNLAEDVLVITLHVETEATMPCAVCNQDVQVKISIPHLCHTVELTEIKGAVFDYQEMLREEILLQLPFTAECNQGDCPERSSMAKYFTKKN